MKAKHVLYAFIILGIMSLASCANRGFMQNGCPKPYGESTRQSKKHWKAIKAAVKTKTTSNYCFKQRS